METMSNKTYSWQVSSFLYRITPWSYAFEYYSDGNHYIYENMVKSVHAITYKKLIPVSQI